jgi:hypothetical protein
LLAATGPEPLFAETPDEEDVPESLDAPGPEVLDPDVVELPDVSVPVSVVVLLELPVLLLEPVLAPASVTPTISPIVRAAAPTPTPAPA